MIKTIKEKEYEKIVAPEELFQIIKKLHHNEMDIYEGNIYQRLYLHEAYELKYVKVSDFDSDIFQVDDYLVEDYMDIPYETMPPIVLTRYEEDGELLLIDGTHRTKTCIRLGKEEILAYVGIGRPRWEDLEEDEDEED